MIEALRYRWNAQRFLKYGSQLQEALNSGNKGRISAVFESAIESGKRALELSDCVDGIPSEVTDALHEAVNGVKEMYWALRLKESHGNEIYPHRFELEKELKGMVKKAIREINDAPLGYRLELSMNTSNIVRDWAWVRLAGKLGGLRQPTADELIAAYISAYKNVHSSITHFGHDHEAAFQIRIGELEEEARGNGSAYLQAALPIYNSLAKKLAGSPVKFY